MSFNKHFFNVKSGMLNVNVVWLCAYTVQYIELTCSHLWIIGTREWAAEQFACDLDTVQKIFAWSR